MLWLVCFFNNADRLSISAIFPKLHDEFGFDKVQLGLIGSAFAWVYAFGSPLAGYLGDRLRRKNLILGGCLFWSVIAAATALCSTLRQFVLVRALVGVGETVYFPASMSMISDYHGSASRSKAMSFHQSSVYIGSIAGSWLTALIAERYGWRLGFYCFGAAGVLLAIVLSIFLREPKRGQLEIAPPGPSLSARESAVALFTKPTAILLLLTFFGANFVSTEFVIWTPTFLVEKFNFHLAAAGLSGTVFIYLACFVGSPLGGILADQFSRKHAGGRMLVQAMGLIFGSAFVMLIGMTHSVTTLLVSMSCFGLGKGLYDSNIFASIYDVIDPRTRATVAGVMNTVGWCGGAIGPLYVGIFAKYGPRHTEIENMSLAIAITALVYVAGACLLLVAATRFAHRDHHRQK
jgi:MFS family permease